MWDPEWDLGQDVLDVPCNLTVLPRINEGVLDITVFCRSNDLIWGAYGANAVHFSVLQEYLARRLAVGIGRYYQISNNFHAYIDTLEKQDEFPTITNPTNPYMMCKPTLLVTEPEWFDEDLKTFFELDGHRGHGGFYHNAFFGDVAEPFFHAHRLWKEKRPSEALVFLKQMPPNCDWALAGYEWIQRRMLKVDQLHAV
jgi:hypothetical protein